VTTDRGRVPFQRRSTDHGHTPPRPHPTQARPASAPAPAAVATAAEADAELRNGGDMVLVTPLPPPWLNGPFISYRRDSTTMPYYRGVYAI